MGNYLDRFPQILASSLAPSHMLIYLSSGDVAISGKINVQVSFVFAKVKIGFAAMVEDEYLAVFGWSHSPSIHVHVGVDLIIVTFSPCVLRSKPVLDATGSELLGYNLVKGRVSYQ
jgi:hypothetical protein